MPQIGTFTREQSGFTGRIHTFTITAKSPSFRPSRPTPRTRPTIAFISAMTTARRSARNRSWKRTGERAGEYIALLIDDPALPQPIRANLFRDDDAGSAWSLHWSRPQKRDGKD
jgi:uncharacterized protein (DUF736 family)